MFLNVFYIIDKLSSNNYNFQRYNLRLGLEEKPMDIRQLRYFVKAYEEGNLSAAASKLFISQQALSKSIKILEASTGRLFVWSKNKFIPTPLGKMLYAEAVQLLKSYDAMVKRIHEEAQKSAEEVRIVMPYCVKEYLETPFNEFKRMHPHVQISIQEVVDAEAEQLLIESDADFGFCIDLPVNQEMFQHKLIANRPLCLMVNTKNTLAKKAPIDLLNDVPANMLQCADARFQISKMLKEAYESAGKPSDFQLSSDQLAPYSRTLRNECVCISFSDIPEANAYKAIIPIPFVHPSLTWDIVLLQRRDKNPTAAVAAFLQILNEYASHRQPDLPL